MRMGVTVPTRGSGGSPAPAGARPSPPRRVIRAAPCSISWADRVAGLGATLQRPIVPCPRRAGGREGGRLGRLGAGRRRQEFVASVLVGVPSRLGRE